MSGLKGLLKATPFYTQLRRLKWALKEVWHRSTRPRHPLQSLRAHPDYTFRRMGTYAGGWVFVDDGSLRNAQIVSAGLGLDASFDVELASEFGARILLVDPTPAAIAHFEEITRNIGAARRRPYEHNSREPVGAYDLSRVIPGQFELDRRALWNAATTLKFFLPANRTDISHSIVDVQNNFQQDAPSIEVGTVTLKQLLSDHGLSPEDIAYLKLDIEGAEVEVILSMLEDGICPRQVAVEYDELLFPSAESFARVDRADTALRAHGYVPVHRDGDTNFLYLKS